MGRMLGSDPDQLDGLGDTLDRAGDRLVAIGGEVSSLLAYAGWEGGDADDFRWQWHHQLTAILRATATQTHEAARILHINAQEQRGASADHGGLPGPGPDAAGPGGPPGFEMPWNDIEKVMFGGGLAAFPLSLLGGAREGILGTNLQKWAKGLPGFVSKLALDDVRGFTAGVKGLVGKVGPLQILSTGIDVAALIDHSRNGREPQAFNSGVNVALDVATIGLGIAGVAVAATVGAPAVVAGLGIGALAVGGAQLAFNIYTSFDEEGAWNWTQDRVADVSNAFDHAAHAVGDTVEAVGDGVGEAADAVAGVVSGGLDAVGDFFGF